MKLAAYLIFFLSGAAGLVYQVVWARLLHEIFGVTIYAVTSVLVAFLGGLALGGVALGPLADRRDPFRLYGWLEIGIAVAALLGLATLGTLEPLHVWAANRWPADSPALVATRALLAAAVVLPPTFLMGGTLPAMTRAFVPRMDRLGPELAGLYGVNAAGAVAGTLGAGFVLIRAFGLRATLGVAVATNLAVGVAALALAARRGPAATQPAGPPARARRAASRAPSVAGAALPLVMALSGFASLGLEVAWTRALVLALGASTYAFATMLATFLLGITLGSLLARMLVTRVRDLRVAFGWIELGIAASALATLPLLRMVNDGATVRWLADLGGSVLALVAGRFGVCFLVMLVPTTLIGATFPIAGMLFAREDRSLGGRLGRLYGANTAGNIVGAAATGFVLLPALGLQRGIALLAALALPGAAWGLLPNAAPGLVRRVLRSATVAAAGAASLFLVLGWRPPPFAAAGGASGEEQLYYREGVAGVVSVYQDLFNPRHRAMLVDGVTIGLSFRGIDEKQQALAHFPFLLLPEAPPRRVLTIGLGTGILTAEVAKHESVEAVDAIELSSEVIEASRLFAAFNDDLPANPRVRIVADDGINFLRRRPERYDAIISDAKSRVGHAGNAPFFAVDFYRACREHLTPGGLMIQWIPFQVSPEELPVIFRSFAEVFPHTYLWVAPPLSSFLVGTMRPLVLDVPYLQRALAAAPTAHLRRYGWRDAYSFVSMLTADGAGLAAALGTDRVLNTFDRPVLEFYSPRAYAVPEPARVAANLTALARARRDPLRDVRLVGADPAALAAHDRAAEKLLEGSAALAQPDAEAKGRGIALLAAALEAAPDHGPLRYAAARAHYELGGVAQARGDMNDAVAQYREALRLEPDFVEAQGNLAGVLTMRREFTAAREQYAAALAVDPEDARIHYGLGVVFANEQRFGAAADHFRRALSIYPQYAAARQGLDRVLAAQNAVPR